MKKIAIMTDSNSGITQEKGKELGVCVLPMPFFINEKLYFEDITLTQEEFTASGRGCGHLHFPAVSREM